MFKNIRGIITFEVITPQPELFINTLKNSMVSVSGLSCRKNKVCGNVYRKDFDEIRALAEKFNSQISIKEKIGGIFIINRYKMRTGIITGIVLASAMVGYLSNVVMNIEVYGNKNMTDKQLISILSDYGISIGTFIPNVDLRETERKIVSSIDNIAWIGIRSSGSRIQVEISEVSETPEMVPTSVPCNIVSSRDAQIVEIRNVHMGMLVPMLYEGVKKGDLLISGTVEDGKGGVYYSHAMGEIIGRYNEEVVFHQPFEDEYLSFGETVKRKSLLFGGVKIPLYWGKNNFENYEYDENMTYLKLFNIQLPVGILKSEYNLYSIDNINYTYEQAKSVIEDKIKLYEYNFYDGDDIVIVDKEVVFLKDNHKITAEVKYTVEGNIGVAKEIMAK